NRSDGHPFAQSQANLRADLGLDLRFIQPARESFCRRYQRIQLGPSSRDLRLLFDSVVACHARSLTTGPLAPAACGAASLSDARDGSNRGLPGTAVTRTARDERRVREA